MQFLFSIAVIVTLDNLILYIHNRRNFVLTYTCSDWCREENGRGPDPECVRTIRPLRRSSECHDISEPVPVRHSGKIRQRETEHTGRLWQPSDWSSGINTDITSGMIDVIFRPTFFSRYLEINFHRLQKWLSPFHVFFVLIGLYKKSIFLFKFNELEDIEIYHTLSNLAWIIKIMNMHVT